MKLLPFALAVLLCNPACIPSLHGATETVETVKSPATSETNAAGVIRRVFGAEAASRFTFGRIAPGKAGEAVYVYEAKDGRVTVRGSSVVAMTRGAYDYLRVHGLGESSWSATRVDTAKPWPDCAPTVGGSPVPFRYYFNVVTYGYTTPYWTWERWEKELDWMAIHGVNMPLALVANEAIAGRVWKKLGLTQAEIDGFVAGPAHLPWHRMGNIGGVDGPPPASWNTDQIALQHRLLDRMKALDITPITPAFAGFVPKAFSRLFPDAKLHETAWGGFPASKRTHFLSPGHPAFEKVGRLFNEEWDKEFGKSRYRLADSFNEMELPDDGRTKAELLAEYGGRIFKSVSAGDPGTVWVMQGWMFGYQRNIWTPENLKALLSGVPDDRMLLLDLAADYNACRWHNGMNWNFYSGFYNKPWVYSVIPNMGGKTMFTGVWDYYAKGFAEALDSPNRGRLVGGGLAGEGSENNELLQEIVLDSYWRTKPIDLDTWLLSYAQSRYGSAPSGVIESLAILRKTCNAGLNDHPSFNWQVMRRGGTVRPFPAFYEAAGKFLSAGESLKGEAAYRADAVEFAALALGMRADEWFRTAYAASDSADDALRDRAAARGLELLAQADRLLESHPYLKLSYWTGFARSHGESPAEKDYYEQNAKRIVTVWGPPINDYSCRVWSGLIRDFYAPRMKAVFEAIKSEKNFDRRSWEEARVTAPGVSAVEPFADPVASATELLRKSLEEQIPAVAAAKGETLDTWSPAKITGEWKTVELPISGDQARRLTAVRFDYKSGKHALDIRRVALVGDGAELAVDKHDGFAGTPSSKNTYKLRLPEGASPNNACLLRIEWRGKDGTDSSGMIRAIGR